mgnify:CR=1 FL=1|tara:strand:- start:8836 stop:10107 length:1272 start_codon:yes stop_codon:yes gene_type:complete
MAKEVIAFCGMTHLGLNSAVAGAERGFELICFDPDTDLIDGLNKGITPVSEPDLDRLISKNIQNLMFTSDLSHLHKADVVYVAPDVSTDNNGLSDLTQINNLLKLVEPEIREDAALVILSQVPPGFTRKISAGTKKVYYQVETLIFGRAIERALYPERYIIGCSDPTETLHLSFENYLIAHECPILPMRFESAELGKIAINCCLVSSISVANTLSELCEGIGADWSEIVPALKLDRRIGQYSYLAPGLGISGGNLERDLATVCNLGKQVNSHTDIVHAWINNSVHRKKWVADQIIDQLSHLETPIIALLGLSYKENTHSLKNAPSITTLEKIRNMRVQAFDPVVKMIQGSYPLLTHSETALKAVCNADAVAIMTPWSEFSNLTLSEVLSAMNGNLVIDPWGVMREEAKTNKEVNYKTLGSDLM